MNIRLPKKFIYTSSRTKGYAYVNRGKLYVKGYINYEDLMYDLTYELNGYERCSYCGIYLSNRNRTLDHRYPRVWGGISLPDNLLPSCRYCNQEKSEMTYEQFQKYIRLPYNKKRSEFYEKCIKENTKIIKSGRYVLPKEWITQYDITEIVSHLSFKNLEEEKSKKLENYYDKFNQYPHPIIVSVNGWLFKGKHILEHAKRHRKTIVPAVVLENVIVIKKSP